MSIDQIIDDHGLEAIRKSAEEIPPRDPSDDVKTGYRIRVRVKNESTDPVPVEIVDGTIGEVTNVFASVTSVPKATLTTILSYTVPSGQDFFIRRVAMSGENKAKYQVEINSVIESTVRTYFTEFNATIDFFGLKISGGDVLKVRVTHNRDEVGDFESQLVGELS